MRIRIKIEKSNVVPNPENCWSAELEYDNKPVTLARKTTLMVAAEFCKRSPFQDRRQVKVEFWDFSRRQVRTEREDEVVIYKLDNENLSNLRLFLFGIVATSQEFDGIQILISYLGQTIELESLNDANNFIKILKDVF